MKVVAVNRTKDIYNSKDFLYSISILPDSSITKDADLFYNPFPNFRIRFSAGICLKISKIGKCISEKFAPKYYENISLAVHFYSDEYKSYCINKSIDTIVSYAFDKSFCLLDFAFTGVQSSQFSIQINDAVYSAESIGIESLNKAIVKASEFITLKVGDIVFVPYYLAESDLEENDTLSILSVNEKICSIKIK